jgi:hypothetical protein
MKPASRREWRGRRCHHEGRQHVRALAVGDKKKGRLGWGRPRQEDWKEARRGTPRLSIKSPVEVGTQATDCRHAGGLGGPPGRLRGKAELGQAADAFSTRWQVGLISPPSINPSQ